MPLPRPRAGESLGFHVYPSFNEESTLGNPETIVWSSIHHLCSRAAAEGIAWRAHKIARKKDRASVAANLKLYIQQAYEFYQVAATAKPNTAPLIYYYSFLNLAKGLCELKKPQLHEREECYSHGLSWRPDPRTVVNLATERVTVTNRRGIWHALWEALTLSRCPVAGPTKLPVRGLFSHCPEISSEFIRLFGRHRLGCLNLENCDVMYGPKTRESWLTFSLLRWELRTRGMFTPRLLRQIATPRSSYVDVLSANKESRKFESAIPKVVRHGEDVWSALQLDVHGINAFALLGSEGNLQYFVPIQKYAAFPLPQAIVSYTVLFWLGSLVRYDPHSVRWLMDSEYWVLIDGFMSQSRVWLLELFEWAYYNEENTLSAVR